MSSQKLTTTGAGMDRSAFQAARQFATVAARLVFRGLLVAVVMGVIFGLLIGVGGLVLGVEVERLRQVGFLSGGVSSFIAMVFVFAEVRRGKHLGP